MSKTSALYNDLLSSLISEVKNYNGKDPLLPWLRGIRKMRESLPPQLLKEKLPRFLQKCAQAFLTDRRYTNDMRYLRVWLQLMDFVEDPKAVLRTMEASRIGMKKSLFYQAYALYYEKMKKFDAAEKMYHLGVQNLAEPHDELQKSYEQFIHRMERHKTKRNQCQKGNTDNVQQPSAGNLSWTCDRHNDENICKVGGKVKGTSTKEYLGTRSSSVKAENNNLLPESSAHEMLMKDANHVHAAANFSNAEVYHDSNHYKRAKDRNYSEETKAEEDEHQKMYNDNTIVVKFVDTAIVGKSDAEDARHHGLVEPTINTKEAMNAINNMFREPIEPSHARRRPHSNQSRTNWSMKNALEVFVDEKIDAKSVSSRQNLREDSSSSQSDNPRPYQPLQEPLKIFIDNEENDSATEMIDEKGELDKSNDENLTGEENSPDGHFNSFVFPCPSDVLSECSKDKDAGKPYQAKHREDTVVYRFVDSTILDEPEAENVCHHGLVDPTLNLKEAMDDINSMFGKPIEFARICRAKKQEKTNHSKNSSMGFLILPDDDLDCQLGNSLPNSSMNSESGLFEQTVCTREAIAEINKMFGEPLDF